MNEDNMLLEARKRLISILASWFDRSGDHSGLKDEVVVCGPQSCKEAIGEQSRHDFPLLRGKEVLLQAVYRESAGQAFTSSHGRFSGSLEDVLDLPLKSSFERAVLVSTMNAVLRYLGMIGGSVHCRNDGPEICAIQIAGWIAEQKVDRVGLVGLQPAILEALADSLGSDNVMVSDLADAENVRYGVKVLDGMNSSEIFERCPLILITGSTLVNGTVDGLMENAARYNRRVVFYGTTISGAAYLLGLERLCPCAT